MESKFKKPTDSMKKLFEIYSGPSSEVEGGLDFQIVPSEELEKNMNPDWIDRMGSDIADLFIEYANRAADGEDAFDNNAGIIKMVAKINDNNNIIIENTALEVLEDMIDEMDESKLEAFRHLSMVFSNKVIELLCDHLDTVSSLTYNNLESTTRG